MYDHLEALAARELVRHREPGYTATKDTNPCHASTLFPVCNGRALAAAQSLRTN